MDCYILNSDIEDKYDLGYYYVHDLGIFDTKSMGTLANYIDYVAFGRDIAYQQIGEFTSKGYLEEVDSMTTYYLSANDIPDEAHLFSYVDHKSIEFLKNTELGTEENYNNIDGVRNNIAPEKDESKGKTSLLSELKETKETVKEATKKDDKENHTPSKDEDCR